MIIKGITISNFGLYKGKTAITLEPDLLTNKNITVLSGQNGVGKSTLLEAIHLCLLGSLSIDDRVSEAQYENYLLKRCYKGHASEPVIASVELIIEFIKSGSPVKYVIYREWSNNSNDVNERLSIQENGKLLDELTKKEKNLFLRELIQPGLAKVMFFDGEKLLTLYDGGNLSTFIAESCRYLFGLNFVDLLRTDLTHYINKLYNQQDTSQELSEIKKVKEELVLINTLIISLEDEKSNLVKELNELKVASAQVERRISDQGRWAVSSLDKLKVERQQLEAEIANAKKNLVEVYSTLGPFVFCKSLLKVLKERLLLEREMEKWQNAKDLLRLKVNELILKFGDGSFLNKHSISEDAGRKLLPSLEKLLLATPEMFSSEDKLHHKITDSERSRLINWIDEVFASISNLILKESEVISRGEERLKLLGREQSSFSKEDLVIPLLREIQDINKKIGANEQRVSALNKKIDDANKRKEYYSTRLSALENKLLKDGNFDGKLKLSSRTKLVLEEYAKELLSRKLQQLELKVLKKFNLLCRKDSYLDEITIDAESFGITLSRKDQIVEHSHLSAGEKQLLILSFLWGLRELTNISLPLIIDTPLARLDLEHRRAFIEQFLPEIQPQVILIGTDMELADDVISGLEPHTAHHYVLEYNSLTQSTHLTEIERTYTKKAVHEV